MLCACTVWRVRSATVPWNSALLGQGPSDAWLDVRRARNDTAPSSAALVGGDDPETEVDTRRARPPAGRSALGNRRSQAAYHERQGGGAGRGGTTTAGLYVRRVAARSSISCDVVTVVESSSPPAVNTLHCSRSLLRSCFSLGNFNGVIIPITQWTVRHFTKFISKISILI